MILLLVLLMLGLFALNAPVAVAVGASSLLAFLVKGDMNLMLLVQRMCAGADSFPLMAVPLFMMAGLLMEAGGLTRRLIDLADALVGWLPGGLAAVSVVSAMFFAGISGSAAADTAAVGGVLIPAMRNSGYSPGFSAAVQASAGSIGVIIPPSIPMIIFGVLTGASIGKLFAAGILPGLLMALSLTVVAMAISARRGYRGTGGFSLTRVGRALRGSLWALGAPTIILGGILCGVFTATESAAVAVFYALLTGFAVYRELSWRELPRLFVEASITASVIMFIIASATAFSWLLTIEQVPTRLASVMTLFSDNPMILLLLVNLVLLAAGTVIETTAALILFVPVLAPMLGMLQVDMIHLGAMVVINLAIGMLTPPLGICLIVSSSIARRGLGEVSRQILPFLLILVADLLLIAFWPPLTMWLPNLLD